MGGVIPFTFDERLDRSIALRTRDYVRIAKPRFEGIAQRGASSQTADLSPADA
jgi:hypothetical protein